MTLLGPYLVACILLVVAGLGKALRPGTTVLALAAVAPRVPPTALAVTIRVLALTEAGLGLVAALVPGRPLAAAVAGSYGAFALFVVSLRARHGALASCGCFATPDTPATGLHVVVNLALGAAAVTVSVAGTSDPVASLLARQPLDGVPLLMLCAAAAWLVVLVFVGLARLTAVRSSLGDTATGRPPALTGEPR